MATFNQGDLYVLSVASQSQPDFKIGIGFCWYVVVDFKNLSVEQSFFEACLKEVFECDFGVSRISPCRFQFMCDEFLDETMAEKFLENKSGELLDTLSKHLQWGQVGGPNLKVEHEILE